MRRGIDLDRLPGVWSRRRYAHLSRSGFWKIAIHAHHWEARSGGGVAVLGFLGFERFQRTGAIVGGTAPRRRRMEADLSLIGMGKEGAGSVGVCAKGLASGQHGLPLFFALDL